MKTLRNTLFAMGLILLSSSYAFAATNPSDPGTTSTATADITLTLPKLIMIKDVNDFSQTYDGSAGGFDQNDAVCVYSNMDTSGGKYKVNITGSNNPKTTSPTDGFYVGNAGTDQEIPYTVKWNDAANTTGNVAVTSGTDLTDQTGYSTAVACGTNNANIQIQMTQANIVSKKPGDYTGRITIVLTPQ